MAFHIDVTMILRTMFSYPSVDKALMASEVVSF